MSAILVKHVYRTSTAPVQHHCSTRAILVQYQCSIVGGAAPGETHELCQIRGEFRANLPIRAHDIGAEFAQVFSVFDHVWATLLPTPGGELEARSLGDTGAKSLARHRGQYVGHDTGLARIRPTWGKLGRFWRELELWAKTSTCLARSGPTLGSASATSGGVADLTHAVGIVAVGAHGGGAAPRDPHELDHIRRKAKSSNLALRRILAPQSDTSRHAMGLMFM